MTTNDIIQILRESALHLKIDYDAEQLQAVRANNRSYDFDELPEFKRDLTEAGRKINLTILDEFLPQEAVESFVSDTNDPIIFFNTESGIRPCLVVRKKSSFVEMPSGEEANLRDVSNFLKAGDGRVIALVVIAMRSVIAGGDSTSSVTAPSPARRFLNLLATEKREIFYILVYALVIGLLSLVLPLGLQTTIELISGGVFFSSVYLLISLVILGVLATGILQIVQVSMVEHLQRRLFVKAALEFAYRIPRIRLEALTKSYAPELVNRFFDVTTIQKGLPKFLLDLSAAIIQVIFGLLLLSLYHPFFVFFSLALVTVLTLMLSLTGPRGLNSSINESKYKYKVAQWLEEIARTLKSFKLAGTTDLPIRKTDELAGSYIRYRTKHFNILRAQFSFVVFFKVAITGGLLIMGTILVVDRQITLGQFVASEVIIILVLNSVEKIILNADVVYDLLTAVDKVSHVTDLPVERSGGFDLQRQHKQGKGYSISLSNVSYTYSDSLRPTLHDVNLNIEAGERVCICGPGSSGKTTLTNIIGGLYTDYTGGVSINQFSLRDLDLANLRDKIAKNISPDDIFDGTVYENITIGKHHVTVEEVLEVIEQVGLSESLRSMPQGLQTHLISGGKQMSSSFLHRLILARCLAKKPELLILNDFFSGISKADKLELIRCVINPKKAWTLIAVSNDPLVMAACDRVIVMDEGRITADDSYHDLLKNGVLAKYFE